MKRTYGDVELLTRIRAIHASSRGSYGAPRIHVELAEQGLHEAGVRLSMGTVADCFDNAFFATLECELLARTASTPVNKHV